MKITCIVDDRAAPDSDLHYEHGASFVIEIGDHRVLFDTGQTDEVLLYNLQALGFQPSDMDALVLSHGHSDHTGGLPGLLAQTGRLPFYAHRDVFRERFRKTDFGPKQVGPAVSRDALADKVIFRLGAEPTEVVPGLWTTGEITSRPEPEGRSVNHLVQDGNDWIPDPYRDDLSLVIKTESGLVLLCGCCHAGLLNTLAHVRTSFGEAPTVVVGGTHLVHADSTTMEHVVEELESYGPPQMHVGHCTGERAYLALKAAFGDAVSLYRVGSVFEF